MSQSLLKKLFSFFILALCFFVLAACASKTKPKDDVLTQYKTEDGKIPVTISLKYSVYLDTFEEVAEKRFPELDLIQVGNYTANYSEEYEQQLLNDDLTDIIITWPLDNAAQNCEGRLIDLSGMDFTSRYNLSALSGISQNGSLYYLPGPTQVRGLVYNKTMFEENGWQVPTDFDSFIQLCQEIEESGMRSLQMSFWNKEVLRAAFIGFGYSQSFSSPASTEALQNYNSGSGSLADFALPAFESFKKLMDAGVFRPEDLDVRYPIREQMLFDSQCAMVSDGLSLIGQAAASGATDEFAIMPFFCPGDRATLGHLIPTQYIGLNQNLTKPENKEKYELVLKLMDFISTQEGQRALANNDAGLVSSLKQYETDDVAALAPIKETIERKQYAIFPTFTNVENELYEALAAMLRGEIDTDEVISRVDIANRNPAPRERAEYIGTASETFSLKETGSYVTDVLRKKAETDLALFLDNGKDGKFNARGISGKLYKGAIRTSDIIQRVLPTLQHGESGYLNIITISGENLRSVLEYTLSDGDWFYYFSGLKMTYDPTAQPGSRIKSITEENGREIDSQKLYRVAVMEGTVDEQWIDSCETTEIIISELIIEDVREKGTITPAKDGRFQTY